MKKFLKSTFICSGALVVSFVIAFLCQYQKKMPTPIIPDKEVAPLTDKEILLNSLSTISCFDCDASIDIKTEDDVIIDVDFSGQGDASNLQDIKLGGHLDMDIDGLEVNANLGYFDGTMFFDFKENYFSLETNDLLDFIKMIPSYGLSLEMPLDISSFSIGELEDSILSMDDKEVTPQGEYFYTYHYNDDLTLYIKTNEKNEFTGIRTDTMFYKNNMIKLDIDLNRIGADELNIENPKEGQNAFKYQDFKPAFTIIDDAMRFIKKDSATINLAFDLKKYDDATEKDILSTDLNISYDKTSKLYGIEGSITENERDHEMLFAYQNATLYAHYHDLKVSVQLESLEGVVNYILRKIGDDTITEALGAAAGSLTGIDLDEILAKADGVLGTIGLTSTTLEIELDPTVFDIDGLHKLTVKLDFDDEKLISITIKDLNVMGYGGDIVITFLDFVPLSFNEEEYVSFDPAFTLVEGIDELLDDKQFRIEFNASLDKVNPAEQDITFDGGLQFDIEDMFGYGEIDIMDGTGYNHNVKIDMKSPAEILFAYNDAMYGKFDTDTMRELIALVADVINDPDEHFQELFGDLMNTVSDMPIMEALNGDIGLLFSTKIIKDLEVTPDYLQVTLYLDIVGMQDKTVTIKVNYKDYHFAGIDISSADLLDGTIVNFHGELLEFDESLETSRLDPYEEYMDFSDIKVLLELGINTSKFDYFRFTSTINLSLGSLLGDLFEIPLDVAIRNDHGDVKVVGKMSDIPTIIAVNKNSEFFSTSRRDVTIYYADGLISIDRVDAGREHIYSLSSSKWELIEILEPDYFVDNILEILLKDVLGLSDTMYNLVGNLSKDESEQIHYEEILNSFVYNEKDGYFFFDINIAEIAHSTSLKSLTLKVYALDSQLTGLDVNLSISVLISIKVDMTLSLVEKDVLKESNRLTEAENFMTTYGSYTHNTQYISIK